MGSLKLQAGAIAAVGAALWMLAACSDGQQPDEAEAEAEGPAAEAEAQGPEGTAEQRLARSEYLYLCPRETPTPPGCVSVRQPADRPGIAVAHGCAQPADPPPQNCTAIRQPTLVGGPLCPGPGCPVETEG
jgi:hypothetical protein